MGEALEMPPKLAIVKTAMVEANPYFFVRVQIWSPLNAGEMPEIKQNPGGVKSKRGNTDNNEQQKKSRALVWGGVDHDAPQPQSELRVNPEKAKK